jgi:hypothetical protein
MHFHPPPPLKLPKKSSHVASNCSSWSDLQVLRNCASTLTFIIPSSDGIQRSADSAAACDPSTSTSRRASPRGLGYFYSTTWEAIRLRSISGHILQDDPSIREEVLDSRLGGSVPRVLRFFLSGFFRILLPRLQMNPQPEPTTQPKARGLLHMECDFAIALPYQLRLQDNTGIFEDLRGQYSRTLGTTREDFKIAQISAGVHSSLGMLRLLLRTFDL